METRLARFLLKYPHSSTGVSPSELLMGRRLRTQLDLVYPDTSQVVQRSQDRQRHTTAGLDQSTLRKATPFTLVTTDRDPRGSQVWWWNRNGLYSLEESSGGTKSS